MSAYAVQASPSALTSGEVSDSCLPYVVWSSPLSVMECMLRILGTGVGDQVITSAYSRCGFVSTIANEDVRVELADVDERITVDAAGAQRRVRSETRTDVIRHADGVPAGMRRLAEATPVKDVLHGADTTLCERELGSFGGRISRLPNWTSVGSDGFARSRTLTSREGRVGVASLRTRDDHEMRTRGGSSGIPCSTIRTVTSALSAATADPCDAVETGTVRRSARCQTT